eukprot:scaffold40841_cov36-Phaeocystis_antarctica.AAC.1
MAVRPLPPLAFRGGPTSRGLRGPAAVGVPCATAWPPHCPPLPRRRRHPLRATRAVAAAAALPGRSRLAARCILPRRRRAHLRRRLQRAQDHRGGGLGRAHRGGGHGDRRAAVADGVAGRLRPAAA